MQRHGSYKPLDSSVSIVLDIKDNPISSDSELRSVTLFHSWLLDLDSIFVNFLFIYNNRFIASLMLVDVIGCLRRDQASKSGKK